MKPHQRLVRRSLVALLVAAAAGLATTPVGTAQASTEINYCWNIILSGACHSTDRHSYFRNQGITDVWSQICVYYRQGSSPYYQAGYTCGVQNAVITYCGCELMYPYMEASGGRVYGFARY